MGRYTPWIGLAVLVVALILWRCALVEERPDPGGKQAAAAKPDEYFTFPRTQPPRILPLAPPRPPAAASSLQGTARVTQASFEEIASNRHDGRAWFQLRENPRIHVLDYESLHAQGQALNRIAAFLEWQEAPKSRVLDDQALAAMIERTSENPDTLFFGHDYRAADLVHFFNSARLSGIALNEEEQALLALLLEAEFMRSDRGRFSSIPPEKVLIAIPSVQADNPRSPQNESITQSMRVTILSHELGHGEFFTNPDYARYCEDFWRNTLSAPQREAFTRFLSLAQHYDARNERLLINEFQAYLAYSGIDGDFFGYDVVAGISAEEMKRLRERFIAHSPANFRPLP
jgi:hypothetical protein